MPEQAGAEDRAEDKDRRLKPRGAAADMHPRGVREDGPGGDGGIPAAVPLRVHPARDNAATEAAEQIEDTGQACQALR
jgi:hypothetical protein